MVAKRNTRNQSESKSMPWGLMLLSFVVGAFVMFLLHLKDNVTPETSKKADKQQTTQSTAVEPTFDFYTLLPEMEVMVDEKKTRQPKPIATSPSSQATDTKQKKSVSYLLQVGSFKKMADADAFRAKLAFLGIESKVQTVTIDNKSTWHRVQVGPISGRGNADVLQKKLKRNDIDSLLMRAKHG